MDGIEDKTQEEKKQEPQKTEQEFLKPGIIKEINGTKIPFFPDYTSEIIEYLDGREKEKTKPQLPFVNQGKILLQIARTLSTSYPYAVLVGESGIGKSMVLEYAVDILTGKVSLAELDKVMPEAVPLFQKIIEQTSKFDHRKYLAIPNMADPLNVKTIAYTNQEILDKDSNTAAGFCGEVENILEKYSSFSKDNMRIDMSLDEFKKLVKTKLHTVYKDTLEEIQKNMFLKRKNDSDKKEPVGLLHFTIPKNVYDAKKQVKANIELIIPKGADVKPANGEKEKKPLLKHKKELLRDATDTLNELLYQASITDITGITTDEKKNILKTEIEDYTTRILDPIYERSKNGGIRSQKLLIAELMPKVKYHIPERKVSESTIDNVIKKLDDLRAEYVKEAQSENLKSWINSVIDYFSKERKIIGGNLLEMIRFDETENQRLRDEKRKKLALEDRKKEEEKRTGKKIKTKTKEEQNKEKEKEKEKNIEKKEWSNFLVPHGVGLMKIEEILTIRELGYDFPTAKGVTWTKLGNIKRETLFGVFDEFDPDADLHKFNPTAPHETIGNLGAFFKSGLLLFPDSFKSFMGTITSEDYDTQGMKEQFLEFLQTGILTIVRGDVSYRFDAPKIILGCDNEDPFLLTDGTIFIRDEAGFRSRIKTINVPHIANNTPEVRKGTISVLYKAIEKYVENSQIKGKPKPEIKITPQAANMLLQTTMHSERLTKLEYRQFVNRIEEICAYAVSKGTEIISPELLKEQIKDGIPPFFFIHVDYEKEFGGYFDLPLTQIGHVHGLSVAQNMPANIVKVNSYFKPGLEEGKLNVKHFELTDIESEMTNETTIKGYDLAKDLVSVIMAKAQTKGKLQQVGYDWQIKTNFLGEYKGIGGPSASLAIALSMISAIADEPIYKNRFVTGTIESMNGNVGPIGGTYLKSLIPLRIKELLEEQGEKEETYFLFPARNLKDLTQEIIFDPFNVEKRLVCLPITNIAQAYHLFTCGPKITVNDWKNAQKFGEKKLDEAVRRIYEKFQYHEYTR